MKLFLNLALEEKRKPNAGLTKKKFQAGKERDAGSKIPRRADFEATNHLKKTENKYEEGEDKNDKEEVVDGFNYDDLDGGKRNFWFSYICSERKIVRKTRNIVPDLAESSVYPSLEERNESDVYPKLNDEDTSLPAKNTVKKVEGTLYFFTIQSEKNTHLCLQILSLRQHGI